jgi:hypothetical protein
VSRRLANKAARAARRRERGFAPSLFPVSNSRAPSPYGSTKVPDSEREVVTESLQGGTIRKTYMDTPESRLRARQAPAPPSPPAEPEGPAEGPPEAPNESEGQGEEPSRFADFPMPGHPRQGIVFGAKL